jgi:predicted branched-subunit amino acid permease
MHAEDTYAGGARAARYLVVPTLLVAASFGIAAVGLGWGVVAPVVMSAAVFSGASQFATLAIIGAGGSLAAAVLASVLIASRFLVIGSALAPSMRGGRLQRVLEGQAMVDTSLILARTGEARYGSRRLIGSSAPQYLAWILGTAGGVVLADRVPDPHALGLDALFPAFFVVLIAGELRDRAGWVTMVVAAIVTLALIPVVPAGLPVVLACVAVLAGRAAARRA